VHGVNENGGLATAKHFPGHGDTAADSHIDLPVIKADRARLDALELVPFRAAISAGVGSVMTGHLNVPALEPDANTPATLSRHILTGVLREQLGFEGLVITDAMDMGGITVRFAPGEAAVRAVLAGADALLMPPVPDAAFEAFAIGGEIRANFKRTFGCFRAKNSGSEGATWLGRRSLRRLGRAQHQIWIGELAEKRRRIFRIVELRCCAIRRSVCRWMERNRAALCCWRFMRIRSRIRAKT